ncbi:MAG: cobalamin biosynthesis protein P47K [Acidobacteria bacterium]|nr:cobalamin biosynthesis protein P47K [Acidobacteriota bacterium]
MKAVSQGPARYIMLGGFLGAGKTTAVAALGRRLEKEGLRVGLITNDQSTGLVDSAVLRSHGFSVEEIAGGCFCCRFDSLSEAAERLTRASRPHVFIAEPVGSCTDLVATVSYPLRRIYGHRFSIAPLSVMVDPARAERILGLTEGRSFSDKVVYVYEKQLEEADFIVINKCDELSEERARRLREALGKRFSRARIFTCSARHGDGLEPWFDQVLTGSCSQGAAMELDYDRYAAGEALLGWLNCTVRLQAEPPVDGNRLLLDLAGRMGERLDHDGLEIAHLKMTLDSRDSGGCLAVVSLVGNGREPDLRESLLDMVSGGTLILNLRAEADPGLLKTLTEEALAAAAASAGGLNLEIEHLERFRPARPVPTHRLTVA